MRRQSEVSQNKLEKETKLTLEIDSEGNENKLSRG